MERQAQRHLLREVWHQKRPNLQKIIIVHIPQPGLARESPKPVDWRSLVPRISTLDTRVLEFETETARRERLYDLLRAASGLIPELFTEHLPATQASLLLPVVFICSGLGGLLLKEAIAEAGDNWSRWQTNLTSIRRIIFLGTPHVGDAKDLDNQEWLKYLPIEPSSPSPRPSAGASSSTLDDLHLSASKFVSTLRRIRPEIKVFSCYQARPSRKSSLHLFATRARAQKGVTVDETRARIGLRHEILVPLDGAPWRVLDSSHQSAFHNLMTESIQNAVESFQQIRDRAASPLDRSSFSSGSGSPRTPVYTPRTIEESISSRTAQKFVGVPFIYPGNLLRRRTRHFQPRPNLWSNIEDALVHSSTRVSSEPGPRAVILSGLGGMGKTQAALDFAIASYPTKFDVVLFIVADQRERLSQQYTEIASHLGLTGPDTTRDEEYARERLKSWFRNPVRVISELEDYGSGISGSSSDSHAESLHSHVKWLLILDNVDTISVLEDFWPISGMGSVLVTTRHPSIIVPTHPPPVHLTLDELQPQEAISLLKEISRCVDDAEEINRAAKLIVQQLGGLPLAIDQIGSIISKYHLSLTIFARDYASTAEYDIFYDEHCLSTGYEHSIGSVWAFDSLEQEDQPALLVLNVLSMLDAAGVQEEVMFASLKQGTVDGYPESKSEYHRAVGRLIDRSLVQRDDQDESLHVHRLVQAVARTRLLKRKQDFMDAFNIAWDSVADRFPYRDQEINTAGSIRRWKRCASMFPHVSHLGQVVQKMRDAKSGLQVPLGFLDLLYQAAWWQCERREIAEAAPLTELGLALCDELSPGEEVVNTQQRTPVQFHRTAFWACKIVGALTTGDAKTAFKYCRLRFQSAENECLAAGGTANSFLTATHNTLGQAYAMNGVYDKAIDLFEKSVELRKKMPRFSKDGLYSPYYHMGITYWCMGEHETAAQFLVEAIADREEKFGPNDHSSHRSASLYYALGNVRNSQGRHDEAYALHHRALLICRQANGESALSTLKCAQKLAEHTDRYGLDSDSRAYLQNILKMCGARTDRRREVAQASFLLSRILERQGEMDKSGELRATALDIYSKLHPRNQRTINTLSWDDMKQLIVYDYF